MLADSVEDICSELVYCTGLYFNLTCYYLLYLTGSFGPNIHNWVKGAFQTEVHDIYP